MFNEGKLSGRRIAVLAADGFEKVELVVPVMAMRRQGAEVDIISLRPGKIRGMNLHEPAGRVRVTKTVREANVEEYDGLLIPGGFINPDLLRQSTDARMFVRDFNSAGKRIATLCHGPWLLASAGILEERVLTSWPGLRDDLVNTGATWLDQALVRDGNLISSRGPQDLRVFVKAITDFFSEGTFVPERTTVQTVSSPPRSMPPPIILGAMRLLPRPSLRTVLGIGGALAVIAMAKRKRQMRADVAY